MLGITIVKTATATMLQAGASSILSTVIGYVPVIVVVGFVGYILAMLKFKT